MISVVALAAGRRRLAHLGLETAARRFDVATETAVDAKKQMIRSRACLKGVTELIAIRTTLRWIQLVAIVNRVTDATALWVRADLRVFGSG